jgi:hypothetical protein
MRRIEMDNRYRSNPIAIRKAGSDSDDDDEESSSQVDNVESDKQQKRLLQAPLLGSVPTKHELRQHQMLPPALDIEQQQYGSLRDSTTAGKFLDGPRSYRDARTGDIRRIERRPLQRGIDLRSSPNVKADNDKPVTSSLAAMLDGKAEQPKTAEPCIEPVEDDDIIMLSTSLTALELLSRTDFCVQQDEELPRDSNGNNTLLSRSYSDPSPRLEQQHQQQFSSFLPPGMDPRNLLPPGALLSTSDPILFDNPHRRAAPVPTQPLNMSQPAGVVAPVQPASPDEFNPDTEATFDMDFDS